jgi:outer membrane protein OmpA-like peptidoglycan-associated protein
VPPPSSLDAGAEADGPAETAPGAPRVLPAGVFRFARGSAQLGSEEQLRLVTLVKKLAKVPASRVAIEAFPDEPEPEPKGESERVKLVSQRRAGSAKHLLVYLGISAAKITVAIGDPTTNPSLAGTISLTADPPLPEQP